MTARPLARTTGARIVVVAALVLGALLWAVAWATSSPPGSSPYEDYHLGSIWCPESVSGACPTKTGEDGKPNVQVPQDVVSAAACTAFHSDASGACVETLGQAPAWTNRVDTGEYPGGFYTVMHLFVGENLNASVYTMRLVNIAISVVVLGAAVALLSGRNRRLVAYGALVVSVPLGVYLIASINPSGWSITGVAAAWIGLHGFYTESEARRRWPLLAVAVVGAVMAAVSRADAGAFLALAALAVVVLHLDRVRADLRTLVAPAVVAAIGVFGYLSGSQGAAVAGGLDGGGAGTLGLLFRNTLELPSLLLSAMTGPLNWLDTPMPGITWVPVAVFSTALVFWGVRVMNWRKGLALLGLVGAFCLLPLLLLQLSGAVVGTEVQGRYLTPLLPLILMTALWDPRRGTVERLNRVQASLVVVALVVANAAALHVQIRRFVTGLDGTGFNLNTNVEWWVSPVSPMLTWALGSLGFAVVAASILLVGRKDELTSEIAGAGALR